MGGLSTRAAVVAALAVALAVCLSGCGEAGGTGETREDATDPASVSAPAPLDIPEPFPSPAPFDTRPASCAGAEFYLDDVFLDAATGHRYLALRLRNCSDRALRLDEAPRLTLGTADGRSVEPWMRPWEDRPPVVVPPGKRAFLGLEYLAADRKPRASAIVLSVAGQDLTVTGELDLDTRTRVTLYPWVTSANDLWGS